MSDFSFLAPSEITPALVRSALSKWISPESPDHFVTVERSVDKQTARNSQIQAFLTALASTPGFLDLVDSTPSFTSASDIQFGPELCGREVFDRYMHDVGLAFRFKPFMHALESRSSPKGFISSIAAEAKGSAGKIVLAFIRELWAILDRAGCWPYLPLPEKAVPLVVTNPLRQLFSSRRIDCIDQFCHIYVPRSGVDLQMLVLESCPLLDAPKAIAVVVDKEEGTLLFNALPATVALPIGVPKEVFLETCERCDAWTRGEVPPEKRDRVVQAYHDAVPLARYCLNSFVLMKGETCVVTGVTEGKNLSSGKNTDTKTLGQYEVIAAIYYVVE